MRGYQDRVNPSTKAHIPSDRMSTQTSEDFKDRCPGFAHDEPIQFHQLLQPYVTYDTSISSHQLLKDTSVSRKKNETKDKMLQILLKRSHYPETCRQALLGLYLKSSA